MTTIRITNVLVIILSPRSSLYTIFQTRVLVVFLGGKEQLGILTLGSFESAVLGHWMMLVTD